MDMYQANILDHYKNPRNFGELDSPTHTAEKINPTCGDKIKLDLVIEDEVITDCKFSGVGCAISQAMMSILSEKIIGSKVSDASNLTKDDVLELIGIKVSRERMQCALMGLDALRGAIV